MLGNEERAVRASTLRVGQYLTYKLATITQIKPTDDPWLPEEMLTFELSDGTRFDAHPHELVWAIIDTTLPR